MYQILYTHRCAMLFNDEFLKICLTIVNSIKSCIETRDVRFQSNCKIEVNDRNTCVPDT